ncbi:branched-chain amino acid ABC transporter permease, partial [Frankia gtarii]|uniref:branched-chain amino acid ABC transporter permease n=1 Tax=Frankia gtarii TaxID=2950102 RepID=UPI0021C10F01
GGALDRAIAPHTGARLAAATSATRSGGASSFSWRAPLLALVAVACLPLVLHDFWVGLLMQGVALGVVFLSFTLVTGEGGMIWLCQITFAGVGGLSAAQLSTEHGWPVIAAIVAGGLIALPMGVIIGMLTIRLGDLYVALVTLTFGLLMEGLVFTRSTFLNFGLGVSMDRPGFAPSDKGFTYVELAAFCIIALLIVNLRRSTTGLGLGAVRWSEPASKTIGLSVLQMKVLVAGLAAFTAGIGGGLYASSLGTALPANYATFLGVIWLAVLVTFGIRSTVAAMMAGLAFTFAPGLAIAYLPHWFAQVPPLLFGLGAISVAGNPEGLLAQQARQIRAATVRLSGRGSAAAPPGSAGGPPGSAGPDPRGIELTGASR